MIYQLVKRGYTWEVAVGVAAAVVIGGVFGFLSGGDLGLFAACNFVLLTIFLWRSDSRSTIFEATLPILPREILCANVISGAVLIFLPGLAAAFFLASDASKDQHRIAAAFLEVAAILMLWVIAVSSTSLRRMTSPGIWREATIAAVAIATIVLVLVISKRHFIAPAVFGVCAAGSAALLVRIWRRAPETFEIAGRKATSVKGDRRPLLPSFTWLPMLRALSWLSAVLICESALLALTGNVLLALVMLAFPFTQTFPQSKWISSLPVPRAKVFLSAVLSLLGPTFVAVLVCLLIAHEPTRITILALAATAFAGLLFVLCECVVFVVASNRRLPWYRLLVLVSFAPIILLPMATTARQLRIVERIAAALPGNLGLVIAIVTATVGAIGWIAYKVFCQMEPRAMQIPAKITWR